MRPPERFTTERLLLRRVRAGDATALFETYASDPHATQYLSWRTHESLVQTREFVDHAVASWNDGSEFIWVLTPHDDTNAVGALGAAPGPHGVEIGYVLGRDWWGHGLMVEAVAEVMAWFQHQPDIHRIWAYCVVGHRRSARVLERAGMTHEATLRRWVVLPNVADEPCDADIFAWIREHT
jgi:RimJ/RimL family protein N-acetyltransferase